MKAGISIMGLCALALFSTTWGAPELKDVRWNCAEAQCHLAFSFKNGEKLPSYYQKFNASTGTLRFAFSLPDFKYTDGEYIIDTTSSWVRSVKVSRDLKRVPQLVYLDFQVGAGITSDQNSTQLRNKSDFVATFARGSHSVAKPWSLSKLKKRGSVSTPIVAKNVPVPQSPPPQTVSAPVVSKPEVSKPATEPVVSSIAIGPIPRKIATALLPGVEEVAYLEGAGLEQLVVRPSKSFSAKDVTVTDSNVVLDLGTNLSSGLYKIAKGNFTRGLYWSSGKLVLVLAKDSRAAVIAQGGRLLLQRPSVSKQTLESWVARPDGQKNSRWELPTAQEPVEALDSFFLARQKNAAPSEGGTIQLRRIEAGYIAVDETVPLYEKPSDQSSVLQNLPFGERMQKQELSGLFLKVKVGDMTGFVNRRQVATESELNPAQKERLKRIAIEKPGTGLMEVRFETVGDERVSYSSF